MVITTEGANGPVSGTVASIGLTADTSSGVATFPVVIDVTGTPSGLYAGASASVTIIYHQLADALAVPAAAILPGPGGKTAVHVMVNGHQVTKTVTTGLTVNGLTQITSGLTAGERVVVNLVNISPGSPVTARAAAAVSSSVPAGAWCRSTAARARRDRRLTGEPHRADRRDQDLPDRVPQRDRPGRDHPHRSPTGSTSRSWGRPAPASPR